VRRLVGGGPRGRSFGGNRRRGRTRRAWGGKQKTGRATQEKLRGEGKNQGRGGGGASFTLLFSTLQFCTNFGGGGRLLVRLVGGTFNWWGVA